MEHIDIINKKLDAILSSLGVSPAKGSKYLTAKQVEAEFGIKAQTLRNRSNLESSHKRFIPSVRLNGGRQKYFERKVLQRMINTREERV
ncbi:hypothetical protein [Natronogracilivirga saccharolytica]|uniref:Uncharacterized protein n=1 Tax=Natronogracilivirga saccharolytica TaxID=2812953 RepID=A0A8J7UVW8_9BACT|nr:hypothetical protein [Natronogracilivirga saccharolytica]MBP3192992.1 hypothetical protein [Natronogracilivirga saccharolytica]